MITRTHTKTFALMNPWAQTIVHAKDSPGWDQADLFGADVKRTSLT